MDLTEICRECGHQKIHHYTDDQTWGEGGCRWCPECLETYPDHIDPRKNA